LGLAGAALARVFPGALFFLPLTLISHQRLGVTVPYAMVFKTVFAALVMAIGAAPAREQVGDNPSFWEVA
jgi:hypothetical protein